MTSDKVAPVVTAGRNPPVRQPDLSAPFEVVGKVVSVGPNCIVIESVQKFKVPVPPDIIAQFRPLVIKGSTVGILKLADGTVRIKSS